MAFLRRPHGQDERDAAQGVNQDGFNVRIDPPVVPRPWHDEGHELSAVQDIASIPAPSGGDSVPQYLRGAAHAPVSYPAQAQAGYPQQAAHPVHRSRASARSDAAYATVGRRVLDLADNGDGTLTVVRCMDQNVDDIDIQFEAGA